MTDFADYAKSIANLQHTQALLALARGVCVEEECQPCLPFVEQLLGLLPQLFRQMKLHDELRILVLKLFTDIAALVGDDTFSDS